MIHLRSVVVGSTVVIVVTEVVVVIACVVTIESQKQTYFRISLVSLQGTQINEGKITPNSSAIL